MLNWLRRLRSARTRAQLPLVTTQWGFRFAGAVPDMHDPAEAAHVRAVEELIRASAVFVDAGANLGFFSCLARARGRRVVAIEPFPMNVQSLTGNLAANQWTDVEVAGVALADRAGSGLLYGRDTLASRLKGWAVPDDHWREMIELSTLDSLLNGRFAGQALAIKVDVEGGEFDLIRGAARTLVREPAPSWSIEIALGEHHPAGRNPHFVETFEVFFSRGYAASTVAVEGIRPVTREDVASWAAAGRRGFGTVNYLFVKD